MTQQQTTQPAAEQTAGDETNETSPPPKRFSRDAQITTGKSGVAIKTLDDIVRLAEFIYASEFCPTVPKKGKMTVSDLVVCIQAGAEVGLSPMQSIQNIAPINGRPTLWGDGLLGVCQSSKVFDHKRFKEWVKGEGDNRTSYCQVARVGDPEPTIRSFSAADVTKAKLGNVHNDYPDRMRQMRARGFALRDKFADVLKGLTSREEMLDLETTLGMVDLSGTPTPQTNAEIRDALATPADIPDAGARGGVSRAVRDMASTEPLDGATQTPDDECKSLRGELRLAMKALHDDGLAASLIGEQGMEAGEIAGCTDAGHLQSCIDRIRAELTSRVEKPKADQKQKGKPSPPKKGDVPRPAVSKSRDMFD